CVPAECGGCGEPHVPVRSCAAHGGHLCHVSSRGPGTQRSARELQLVSPGTPRAGEQLHGVSPGAPGECAHAHGAPVVHRCGLPFAHACAGVAAYPPVVPGMPPGHGRSPARAGLRGLPCTACTAVRIRRWRMSRYRAAVVTLGALAVFAPALHAQGVRGSAQTMVRYYEIRPLVDDTIPFADVEARGDGTFFFEGRQVVCATTAFCVRYLSGEKQGAAMLTQDVGMTAWGLGMEGLSATVQLRARADLGGDEFTWPRADDNFDAILAYAELLRGDFRVRAGRLQNTSGLGFSSYDGAHVLYTPLPQLSVQAFGGRSLARGLYEPRHEALEGIEQFFPDRNAAIVGGAIEGRPWRHTSVEARYQREIWWNRAALVSERASLDLTSSVLAPVQL